jgi:hypothetical protein
MVLLLQESPSVQVSSVQDAAVYGKAILLATKHHC